MSDSEEKMKAAYRAAKEHLETVESYDSRHMIVMNLLKYAIGTEVNRRMQQTAAERCACHLTMWMDLCEQSANTVMELPSRYIEHTHLHTLATCPECSTQEATMAAVSN